VNYGFRAATKEDRDVGINTEINGRVGCESSKEDWGYRIEGDPCALTLRIQGMFVTNAVCLNIKKNFIVSWYKILAEFIRY
jgi:hypothetical protein